MPAKIKTVTLGCKVNQYETEFVREGLLSLGYQDAEKQETADLCIVNTCTVTHEGDSKSRQIIRRLNRENPDARIIVMGCYATRATDEVSKLPGVSEVVTDKRELPDLLGRFGVIDVPTGISGMSNRSRAYVKVQDGCLLRCSYCIIPQVRPEMYSRPHEHILDEVKRLLHSGYREIVLTGIHLGHYGVDQNRGKSKADWMRLSHLLRMIVEIEGDFRVRLSSIEATEVTRELLEVMREYPEKVCPHLHICMQSGSESVLRRMKRRWGTRRFLDRCQLVRETLDQPAITTDIVVGFPGETDREFEETLDACREAQFSKIHMFPFSARKGTPAAEMENQIPKAVKSKRGKVLAELEKQLKETYFQSLIGKRLEVLVESCVERKTPLALAASARDMSIEKGTQLVKGTSCRYAPVELVGTDVQQGKLVSAIGHSVRDGVLVAT